MYCHESTEDVCIRTVLSDGCAQAKIQVAVEAAGDSASLNWTLIGPDEREVASGTVGDVSRGFEIEVSDPALWWPWTHGTPHLYALHLSLSVGGDEVDEQREVFGIREIRRVLEDPVTGEARFQFVVNGQPIFLRGANWLAPGQNRFVEITDTAEGEEVVIGALNSSTIRIRA